MCVASSSYLLILWCLKTLERFSEHLMFSLDHGPLSADAAKSPSFWRTPGLRQCSGTEMTWPPGMHLQWAAGLDVWLSDRLGRLVDVRHCSGRDGGKNSSAHSSVARQYTPFHCPDRRSVPETSKTNKQTIPKCLKLLKIKNKNWSI